MAASQAELHQAVLACLQQTTGPDPQGIKAAEAQLSALAQQPGFGVVLVQVALASPHDVAAHLRQLAAVLLKQYVKQHWIQGERGFVPPGGCLVALGQSPSCYIPHNFCSPTATSHTTSAPV